MTVLFQYKDPKRSFYLKNYRFFQDRVRAQGLRLLTIEVAFRGAGFLLREEEADRLVQLRCPSVIWQKEAMWNQSVHYLPSECDKIVFLDCDIIFNDDAWVGKLDRLLDEYMVVQPFSRVMRLDERATDELIGHPSSQMPFRADVTGFIYSWISRLPLGEPGFACAFQRKFITDVGLYDRCVFGSNDAIYADAFLKSLGEADEAMVFKRYAVAPLTAEHSRAWVNAASDAVSGKVTYLPCGILHLWHGELAERLYVERLVAIQRNGFDPDKDITRDHNGLLVWSSWNVRLHLVLKVFFIYRGLKPPFLRWKRLVLTLGMAPFFGVRGHLLKTAFILRTEFPCAFNFLRRFIVRPFKTIVRSFRDQDDTCSSNLGNVSRRRRWPET